MGIDLGNLAALRTFRVLRALKTVAIIPGKTDFNVKDYIFYYYFITESLCSTIFLALIFNLVKITGL